MVLLLLSIKIPFHLPLDTLLFSSHYKFTMASQVFEFEQITLNFTRLFGFTNLQV
jgi:hypothetical protein